MDDQGNAWKESLAVPKKIEEIMEAKMLYDGPVMGSIFVSQPQDE